MKAFRRMTERELLGRKVRLLRKMETRGGRIFGVGTVMTITRKWKGLELEQVTTCEACGCGNRYWIRAVPFEDVDLLPVETAEGGAR